MRTYLLLLIICFLGISPIFSQDASTDSTANTETVIDSVETATAQAPEELGPIPVPEPSEKAIQYYRSGNILWWLSTLWGLLIPALFLFTGFSAKIRDWVQKFSGNWFLVIVGYFIIFLLLNFVIDFALSYYQGYVRPHAYGLSNQTFGKWIGDALKNLMVSAIFGSLIICIPYLLLKKSPNRWWLYTGLLTIPMIILMLLIQPIFIAPLFNDFGEMKDKALETKILALAERAGIEGSRVFEVNKSVDTKAVNAYVTGFMGSKRIVLWDTTIEKLDEEELLFVMGHEMGHYVLGHMMVTIPALAIIMILTLFGIHKLSGFLIATYQDRFGFTELKDIASLPLLILMFGLASFIISPITLGLSRYNEKEADRFGLELLQDNHHAASAFAKLQEENLGNPRPGLLFVLWRASHPTLGDRIDFCNSYHPWKEGKPLKYGGLFKSE